MSATPPPLSPRTPNRADSGRTSSDDTGSLDPIQRLFGPNPSLSKRIVITVLGICFAIGLYWIATEALEIEWLKKPGNRKLFALAGAGIAAYVWNRIKGSGASGTSKTGASPKGEVP